MAKKKPQATSANLDIGEVFAGKNIFFIGATGFVGKVMLTMLVERFPHFDTLYCLLRPPRDGRSAAERFADDVIDSPLFEKIRERADDPAAFDAYLAEHLHPVGGDLTQDKMGMDAAAYKRIAKSCDVVINCSGLVDFNPPLNEALAINVEGVQGVIDFAHQTRGRALIHVSTCYVTGTRDGIIEESPELVDWCPRIDELPEGEFSHSREISGGQADYERVKQEALSTHLVARFREEARAQLRKDDLDPDDEQAIQESTEKASRRWRDDEMVRLGMDRALYWGWPNTYTFTKSLGEQVVAASGLDAWAIVRPSVVESSMEFPFPGWNEGINTSAPLMFLGLKGHTKYPAGDKATLDVIPVDMVASSLIATTAAVLARQHVPVYQAGSSDVNPLGVPRLVELTGLFKRDYYRRRPRGNPWFNLIASWVEPHPVSKKEFRQASAPAISRFARVLSERVAGSGPERLAGPGGLRQSLGRGIMGLSKTSGKTGDIFDMFMPFVHDHAWEFRCDQTRSLMDRLSKESREGLVWYPEQIEWRHYILGIHYPGLEKWVIPRIKEKIAPRPKKIAHYRDLCHLFESTTKVHSERTAMRYLREDGSSERMTYADLREGARAAAGRIAQAGVSPGDRVLLCASNRPEWAAAYFGILLAGATAVPVDRDSSAEEISNLSRAAKAKLLILSSDVAGLFNGDIPSQPILIDQICALEDAPAFPEVPATQPDDIASLIFTSGTTGTPKAVMLTHANFTWLLKGLGGVFELKESDGLLSALPLHHTFEFSCGFLKPLSVGAQLIYMEELNADMLARAFAGGRVTCMVGVPALWELLHRKVKKQVRDKGPGAEKAFKLLMGANRTLREQLGWNLGKLLFQPVHQGFGGRIRFLVSGGASLPPDIHKFFHSLGMDLYEGYGLTEASPVLSVSQPGRKPIPGSVGKALPGVELEISDPDNDGVGEIRARGGNIMQGYLDNEEATKAVLDDDGWLQTGDFGRMDKKGRLFIAGRKKDVIVESSGKNIYPDELEELYGECPDVEEMSIVGIDDGRGGERVACIVVPVTGDDRALIKERIEAHFANTSKRLPSWKRVKTLRIFDGELPRTATRKVKRNEVSALLERMLKTERQAQDHPKSEKTERRSKGKDQDWLLRAIASVCDRDSAQIKASDRLVDDLGFESLMLAELLTALEQSSGKFIEPADLQACQTVGELRSLVGSAPVRGPGDEAEEGRDDDTKDGPINLPTPIQVMGRRALGRAQRWLYEEMLETKVYGQGNVPRNRPLLVVSNHSSHLDMGLIKTAMGPAGDDLVSMAASDYFFREGARRFYFENFTNLMPMEREGSLKESLARAANLLDQGKSVLIFPEGTRSRSGRMAPFKRGVGYLAMNAGADVLPIYLEGTHDALPVGSSMPRRRELAAHVGEVLTADMFRSRCERFSRHKAYDLVTALIEDAVLALRDRRSRDPEGVLERLQPDGASEESPTPKKTKAKKSPKPKAQAPLERLFDDLKGSFRPDRVDAPLSFYFSLGAKDSDKWTLVVGTDSCEFSPGKTVEQADCVLKTDAATFKRIVKEHYVPSFSEFMSGKVKTNAPDLLRTFQKVFGL